MNNKQLCLERDAFRCSTCGTQDDVRAVKLINRPGEVSWHLSNLITLCDKCHETKKTLENSVDDGRLGVLLCGGRGTRLFPITKNINKHLLSISNLPMAFYPIFTLQKMGIKRVVVVVDQFSGSIMETLGSGKAFGMEFIYRMQDGAFGISDALNLARDVAKPNDQIVCILGDNIFDNEQLDYSRVDRDRACMYLKNVPNPEDYGVARIENEEIVDIVEKPKEYISNLAVVGLYVYPPDVFDVIKTVRPSERGEMEISSINSFYVRSGRADFKHVGGYWADCGGSIQRYAEASMFGAKQAKVSADEIDSFRTLVFDDK